MVPMKEFEIISKILCSISSAGEDRRSWAKDTSWLLLFHQQTRMESFDLNQKPEEILHRRLKKKKNHVVTEVLVKWKGLGKEEASWVEYSTLVNEFPDLVDKFPLIAGGCLWWI
ncbi:hypothetical protein Patl1_05727 [Pistacia atlantica]|uniref:Uncharacterized protein n=1 Tax=Pistacia atlantica TaxID=434234 RepID=A0ACC1BSH2_9ROSI|nr:hypothetical protein Patl1_05727 [Pistacia atlantica]